MAKLIVWTGALIFCLQPFVNQAFFFSMQPVAKHAKATAETGMVDPFDMARTDASGGQDKKGWVDPFDMTHYSHGEKKMVKDVWGNRRHGKGQCERNEMEKNFLQRMVNLLINHCQNEGAVAETSVLLTVTSHQLHELYRVKDAADSEAAVRVLNGIFSSMMVPQQSNFIMDIFTSEEVRSNIPAMSFALLPLCIFLTGGTLRRIAIILALAGFAVSYFKTQTLLMKKLEVEKELTLRKPSACKAGRGFFSFLGSKKDADCLQELHAQKIDPSLEVTPIQVISHMTAVGVLQPLEHFGIMFSRFSKEIFDTHSVLYGILVFAVGTLVVLYVTSVCFAGIFGRNFSVETRHVTLGLTGTAEKSIEPAPENQVATKPQTEPAVINHGHTPQPVIQIIHNYPMKPVGELEENIHSKSEQKLVDSIEESHKICEVTQDSSDTKLETSKISESEDNQK